MSTGISFSGLSSGIDSATIIEQLIAIERRPIALLENKIADEQTKQDVLQQINTSLLSVKTRAEALSTASAFDVFNATSSNTDLVGVSVDDSASPGSFSMEVISLAQAQSRSSASFDSKSDALGLSGDVVVNGEAISILSGDSLTEIRDTINDANLGVQAQILQVSDSDYRLLITSETTGADGFSLQDASTTDVLQDLGFSGTATSIKNSITGGAQTDLLASSTTAAGSLLGVSETLSGTVTIGDQTVAIDLSSQSLTDIKNAIDAAAPTGVTTSLVSEEVDGSNYFRLQIDGTTTFVDDSNVLEALGVLKGSAEVSSAVAEAHTGSVGNTTNGSTPVTANTKFSNIFGVDASSDDTVTISGKTHDGTSVSGVFTIGNVNSDTLQDLLDEVESVFGDGVTASVNASGEVVVTDNTAGASQMTVSLQANNEGGGSLSFGTFTTTTEGEDALSREVVAGQDAGIRVNGVTLTRSSNTVTDALDGITLSLYGAEEGTTVSISVTRDTAAIRGAVETFVSDYNSAMSLISSQFVYDEDAQSSGPLAGDATLLALQSQLQSLVSSQVSGLADSENSLTLFGVSFNRYGQLDIDSSTLNDALTNDLTSLKRIFAGNGQVSDSDIEFIYQSDDTLAGTYDISISAAPEQASVLGTTDLSGGLAAAETLTVTDLLTDRSGSIDLEAGDDIETVVSKINSTLGSSMAEVRTGSMANTTDGVTPITSDTALDSLSGAGVVADDTIDIQGNLHNGERVSGSFTISDPATQTVGDLLAEVRSIFQGTISTSIDENGQIVITDNEVGNSSLTVALIERNEGGGSLNFGSIDVTTEGRFAIGVTASNEGGNLKLTADAYGANGGFTVSQTSNETGLAEDTYNGVDVAGTINGEAATGSGRVLTGSSDSANISGLAIRVMLTSDQLTAQGSDQGTVKVTQGVAEQLRRSLKSITDPLTGMIATREDAIDDTIDATQDQIDAMEDRILLKQDMLVRQFTAMETALAEYNAMGSFLGSQLASLAGQTQ